VVGRVACGPGHRVPAVVALLGEPVDLVVAVAALLDGPHRAVGAAGQPLHVEVPVREHPLLHAVAAADERIRRHRTPGGRVDPQHRAAAGRQPLRIATSRRVARPDVELVAGAVRERAPAAAARGRRQPGHQGALVRRRRARAVQPPPDDPDVLHRAVAIAVAGDDAARQRDVVRDLDRHQAGPAAGSHVTRRGEDRAHRAPRRPQAEAPGVALGDQHRPVGRKARSHGWRSPSSTTLTRRSGRSAVAGVAASRRRARTSACRTRQDRFIASSGRVTSTRIPRRAGTDQGSRIVVRTRL
jgi:hypothetical protein